MAQPVSQPAVYASGLKVKKVITQGFSITGHSVMAVIIFCYHISLPKQNIPTPACFIIFYGFCGIHELQVCGWKLSFNI
jgi:hypothetical protein